MSFSLAAKDKCKLRAGRLLSSGDGLAACSPTPVGGRLFTQAALSEAARRCLCRFLPDGGTSLTVFMEGVQLGPIVLTIEPDGGPNPQVLTPPPVGGSSCHKAMPN